MKYKLLILLTIVSILCYMVIQIVPVNKMIRGNENFNRPNNDVLYVLKDGSSFPVTISERNTHTQNVMNRNLFSSPDLIVKIVGDVLENKYGLSFNDRKYPIEVSLKGNRYWSVEGEIVPNTPSNIRFKAHGVGFNVIIDKTDGRFVYFELQK